MDGWMDGWMYVCIETLLKCKSRLAREKSLTNLGTPITFLGPVFNLIPKNRFKQGDNKSF